MVNIKSDPKSRRRSILAVASVLLVITCSCKVSFRPGNIAEDKRAVDRDIVAFHQRFNTQQYKQIYDDAHPSLKTSLTERDFSDQCKKLHEAFGDIKKVTDKWINVVVGPSIEIRAVYNGTFDKGDATERFLFIREGDMVRLYHYQVSPGIVKPDDPSLHYTDGTTDEGVNNPK